ncbi:MAG: hypothetical protein AB1782_11970 [Cyanobacteriota bacterium]
MLTGLNLTISNPNSNNRISLYKCQLKPCIKNQGFFLSNNNSVASCNHGDILFTSGSKHKSNIPVLDGLWEFVKEVAHEPADWEDF